MRYPAFDGTQACATVGTDLFYPQSPSNMTMYDRQAVTDMCYSCRFQSECLEWGVRHELDGFWGGISPAGRASLRRQMGIRLEQVQVLAFLDRREVS